jgi:predicted nucleotidyltransferase
MIRSETIVLAIDAVVAQLAPELVFLIGSHATGTAKRTSDLDLLIVAESSEPKQRREARVEQLLAPLMIPVDINVYTPAEFRRELQDPHSFARLVTELQGKLVYRREPGSTR